MFHIPREASIGSDAKEAQRLRIELHQERIVNKRLSLKLDEMESSISHMQQSNSILNNIDQNEQNEPVKVLAEPNLKVTTSASGNSSDELEIALRQSTRRVKELEEKLVTGHKQGKAKVGISKRK